MTKNNSIIIRLDESKKIDFKVAMLRQRIPMQKLLEAFVDAFVSFDKGDKNPLMEKIVKKAQ